MSIVNEKRVEEKKKMKFNYTIIKNGNIVHLLKRPFGIMAFLSMKEMALIPSIFSFW